MPHIRVIQTPEADGIYVNGVKAGEYGCVAVNDIIDILRDNLGMDIKYYDFCHSDDYGSTLPINLRDFDEEDLDEEDHGFGAGGILNGGN